jgi:hypothetical protein
MDAVTVKVSDEDQQRSFDSPEAVVEYFRQQYGPTLLTS